MSDYPPRDVSKGTIHAGGVTPKAPPPVKREHLVTVAFEETFNGYDSVLICHECASQPHQLGSARDCRNCMNARSLRRDVVDAQEVVE